MDPARGLVWSGTRPPHLMGIFNYITCTFNCTPKKLPPPPLKSWVFTVVNFKHENKVEFCSEKLSGLAPAFKLIPYTAGFSREVVESPSNPARKAMVSSPWMGDSFA